VFTFQNDFSDSLVMPAQAGTQFGSHPVRHNRLGSRLRGNDDRPELVLRQPVSGRFQRFPRSFQAFEAAVFDSAVAVESGVEDDLQHTVVIER
jgi:hypothetical protein